MILKARIALAVLELGTLVYLINVEHVLIDFSKTFRMTNFSQSFLMISNSKPLLFARNMIALDTITILYHKKSLRWVLNTFWSLKPHKFVSNLLVYYIMHDY